MRTAVHARRPRNEYRPVDIEQAFQFARGTASWASDKHAAVMGRLGQRAAMSPELEIPEVSCWQLPAG